MIEVREYLDAQGSSPYGKWFDRLNTAAAARVATAVYRMEHGKAGDSLVILLAGGTKKRQDADISAAKGHWRDYKRRRRQEA